MPPARYDAILCRGVLNDFVDEEGRHVVFAAFARALRPGGVVILDVREWEATAERKGREPIFRKSVVTDRGQLGSRIVARFGAPGRTPMRPVVVKPPGFLNDISLSAVVDVRR